MCRNVAHDSVFIDTASILWAMVIEPMKDESGNATQLSVEGNYGGTYREYNAGRHSSHIDGTCPDDHCHSSSPLDPDFLVLIPC